MKNENGTLIAEMQIPVQGDNLKIEVLAGYPVFILGRNGTGKSALVNFFATKCKDNALYMPGSRPCYFENEKLSMTPVTREQFRKISDVRDYSPDRRWKSENGPMRNEKTILDIQAAQRKFVNARYEQFKSAKDYSTEIEKNQSSSSPLDIINSLLLQANLRVHLK